MKLYIGILGKLHSLQIHILQCHLFVVQRNLAFFKTIHFSLLLAQDTFGWVVFDMNLGICLLFDQVIVSGDDEIDDVVS
jgi:hypothetical protein